MAFQREIKFFAGTSKAQDLDKGIRQKSTKRVNLFIAYSAFCPGPPNCDPRDSKKRWHTTRGVFTNLRVYMASDANWLSVFDFKKERNYVEFQKFAILKDQYQKQFSPPHYKNVISYGDETFSG